MPPSIPSSEENSSAHHPLHHIYPVSVRSRISDSFIHAFSGATAGFASGVIVCPLDVIKTKLQAQGGFSVQEPRRSTAHGGARANVGGTMGERVLAYKGLVGTARTIWKEEGARGMYRGLGPLILGYLPTWTVYFTVYEKTKGVLEGRESFTCSTKAAVNDYDLRKILIYFWCTKVSNKRG
jgi:solute carrier family 25 folate transporter 32